MAIDSEAGAALIAAVVSLVVAALAWLRALSAQRNANKHDDEIARMQHELASSRDRMKSELAKELTAQESVLRVQAELRVKMFELAATAVDEASANVQSMIYTYGNYTQSTEDVTTRQRLVEVTESVIATGMFLPPELTEPFERTRDYVLGEMKAKLIESLSIEDRVQAQGITSEAFSEAQSRAAAFRAASLKWKRAEWRSLTGSI